MQHNISIFHYSFLLIFNYITSTYNGTHLRTHTRILKLFSSFPVLFRLRLPALCPPSTFVHIRSFSLVLHATHVANLPVLSLLFVKCLIIQVHFIDLLFFIHAVIFWAPAISVHKERLIILQINLTYM